MYCGENSDYFTTSSLRGLGGPRRPFKKPLRRLVRNFIQDQQALGRPPVRRRRFSRPLLGTGACGLNSGICPPCGSDISEYTNYISPVCCSTSGQCGTDITPLTNCFPGCCRPGCERSYVWPSRT